MIRSAIIDFTRDCRKVYAWNSNTTELPGYETERTDLGRGLTHGADRDAVSAHV